MKHDREQPAKYEPTPTEIRQKCEDIQKRWSDHERKRRSLSQPTQHWIPPRVDLRDIDSWEGAER